MIRRITSGAVVAAALSMSMSASAVPVLARTHRAPAGFPAPTAVLATPKVFAEGSKTLFNPDGIVVTQHSIFVAWQGQSDHLPGPSTIVKYNRSGQIVGSVAITGRCDGLRLNPVTVFGEGPAGIPVQSFIGTVDAGEIITPLLTQREGVFSPTSLIFSNGQESDGI